jgi:hypothetical protein
VQDALAIGVAVLAGVWLAWSLGRRLVAPPCRPPDAPPGSDGFVPLDALGDSAKNKSGRPAGRPDRRVISCRTSALIQAARAALHQYMS